jgi:glucose/arabinose dehydrogenase
MNSRRSVLTIVIAAAVVLATSCGAGSAPAERADVLVSIGAGLTGPAGLKATVYAKGLTSVAALAFDAKDRLWAATADFEDQGRDALYVITDAGSDPLKVVPSLHTPLGLLWYNESLYVTSATGVDVYSGFDGTKFADHKTMLDVEAAIGKPGGIVLGPDGRMQMGISAPCDSCNPESEYSGAVVSFLPDGSDLKVFAGGIRAPVGLAYYPNTSDLFVTMNQRDDLGAATPGDWLAVVRQDQAWGFPDCYGQGGTSCTGVPQPTAALDPHAAVSGVAIVTGQLGTGIGTSAIVAEWATGKVLRVALGKDGANYTGMVRPFLTGLVNPVPVLASAKGAILVGDWTTGTVFSIAKV